MTDIPRCDEDTHYWAMHDPPHGTPCRCGTKLWRDPAPAGREPLPCPFCGRAPIVENKGRLGGGWAVRCICLLAAGVCDLRREIAIEFWNQRAEGPRPYTTEGLDKIEAQLKQWESQMGDSPIILPNAVRRLLAMARAALQPPPASALPRCYHEDGRCDCGPESFGVEPAESLVGLPPISEEPLLAEIEAKAMHHIPVYAYGDNEAACDMASRLDSIATMAGELLARSASSEVRRPAEETMAEIEKLLNGYVQSYAKCHDLYMSPLLPAENDRCISVRTALLAAIRRAVEE